MVPSATTRIKHARIVWYSIIRARIPADSSQVVKSAIANMIAPSNAISLLTSSVESAATQATWLEIVQIDDLVPTGATTVLLRQAVSVVATPLIVNMSHS